MDLFWVDAFTAERFSGNPAAVCLAEEDLVESLMQAIAAEMNLSETAFVRRRDGALGLRWFTPAAEVALCGHATLAAAHVLYETGAGDGPLSFTTRSGEVSVRRAPPGLEMDFPALETRPIAAPAGLAEALGSEPSFVGECPLYLLVEVSTEEALRGLRPERAGLLGLPGSGVIVTAAAAAGSPFDFVSRFFMPKAGVDEDPVTGSAHCALGPYWSARLGRDTLIGYQASRRGGTVGVSVHGDRVTLSGEAVTVARGSIN